MNLSIFEIERIRQLKVSYYRITVPLMTAFCFLSIGANCYVLLATRWRSRRHFSSVYWFTISLCLSGVWTCLNMALSFILQSYLPHVHGLRLPYNMCFGLAFETFRMGAMMTSVLHLLLLAGNHFVGITRPLQCSAIFTPELTYKLVSFLWLAPPLGFAFAFSVVPDQAFRSAYCQSVQFWSTFSFRLSVCVLLLSPLVVMSLMYVRIYKTVKNRHQDRYLCVSTRHKATYRRRLKAAVTTSIYLLSFLLGWLPSLLLFVLVCQRGCPISTVTMLLGHPHKLMALGVLCNSLLIFKSLCDAFLYAARVREIQLALRVMHSSVCGCDLNMAWSLADISFSSFRASAVRRRVVRHESSKSHSQIELPSTRHSIGNVNPAEEPSWTSSLVAPYSNPRKSRSVCIIEDRATSPGPQTSRM